MLLTYASYEVKWDTDLKSTVRVQGIKSNSMSVSCYSMMKPKACRVLLLHLTLLSCTAKGE